MSGLVLPGVWDLEVGVLGRVFSLVTWACLLRQAWSLASIMSSLDVVDIMGLRVCVRGVC